MIELLLVIDDPKLQTVLDAIDIYEGSVPPSAIFQVLDRDYNNNFSSPTSSEVGFNDN